MVWEGEAARLSPIPISPHTPDDFALTREDPDAMGEQRFVTLGMSATGALLVVVYTHREPDIYRLISSWKANKPQRKQYEKNRR